MHISLLMGSTAWHHAKDSLGSGMSSWLLVPSGWPRVPPCSGFSDEHTVGELLFFVIVAAVSIGAAFGLLWVIEGFALKKDTP